MVAGLRVAAVVRVVGLATLLVDQVVAGTVAVMAVLAVGEAVAVRTAVFLAACMIAFTRVVPAAVLRAAPAVAGRADLPVVLRAVGLADPRVAGRAVLPADGREVPAVRFTATLRASLYLIRNPRQCLWLKDLALRFNEAMPVSP